MVCMHESNVTRMRARMSTRGSDRLGRVACASRAPVHAHSSSLAATARIGVLQFTTALQAAGNAAPGGDRVLRVAVSALAAP